MSMPHHRSIVFLACVLGLLFTPAAWAADDGLKNFFECDKCGMEFCGLKCKNCPCFPPEKKESEECKSARAALKKAMSKRGGDSIGGYTAKQLDDADCSHLQTLARLYADWKTSEEIQEENDRRLAEKIDKAAEQIARQAASERRETGPAKSAEEWRAQKEALEQEQKKILQTAEGYRKAGRKEQAEALDRMAGALGDRIGFAAAAMGRRENQPPRRPASSRNEPRAKPSSSEQSGPAKIEKKPSSPRRAAHPSNPDAPAESSGPARAQSPRSRPQSPAPTGVDAQDVAGLVSPPVSMPAASGPRAQAAPFCGPLTAKNSQELADGIVAEAKSWLKSGAYAVSADAVTLGPGSYKCSTFLNHVLASQGVPVPWVGDGDEARAPIVREYADGSVPGFVKVDKSDLKPGDVVVHDMGESDWMNYVRSAFGAAPFSGHAGIVTEYDPATGTGKSISAGENEVRENDYFGFVPPDRWPTPKPGTYIYLRPDWGRLSRGTPGTPGSR